LRLFISYNTKDEPAVRPIADRFKSLRPEADVYFAPTRNIAGDLWIKTLGEELEVSDAVLLFLGGKVSMGARTHPRPPCQPYRRTDAMRVSRHRRGAES
jgi:hypothetical protein